MLDSVEENEIFYIDYSYQMEQMVQYLKNRGVTTNSRIEKKAIFLDYYGVIKEVAQKSEIYKRIEKNDINYVREHLPEKEQERQKLFQYAAAFGKKEMCQYLMTTDIKINQKDRKKYTAFMTACQYGNLEVAKFLEEKGASVFVENDYGGSSLYIAAMYRQKDVCEWLLKNYKLEMYGHNKELDREIDEWLIDMEVVNK